METHHGNVYNLDALEFLERLDARCIDLFCIDPPYFGIVDEEWDNAWNSVDQYVEWMMYLFKVASKKAKPFGSLVFFGGIGSEGSRPLFRLMEALEKDKCWRYRNMITWKKRRAYGKSHDYLFCREEILWYSLSGDRESVTFNIPYLSTKRGYEGWNKDYPAKSEYKRVSNVWDDIPELMRPERKCQKPLPLMDRIIRTHSNPGENVVDFFAGWGSTGVSAVQNERQFIGCDAESKTALAADERVAEATQDKTAFRKEAIAE